MRDGWTAVTFGDVAHWSSGKFLTPSARSDDGIYPVHGANGIIGRTDQALYHRPVVTVGRVGAVGEVHVTAGPAWVSDNALVAQPQDAVMLEYLALALGSFDFRPITGGTTQPLVTQTALKRQLMFLPPIAEQRRIVDLISAVNTCVEAATMVVEQSRSARAAIVTDLLSGEHEIPESYDRFLTDAA